MPRRDLELRAAAAAASAVVLHLVLVLVLVLVLEPPPAFAGDPPRRAATPNGALAFELPEGWNARPLSSGVALEPPGNPLDETIVAACEPYPLASLEDDPRLEELLSRLRAGQLAKLDESPRPKRERLKVASGGVAAVVTYRGSDDGGRPAALRIAVLPAAGRVALLTARLPAKRLEARAKDLDAIVASFAPSSAEDEKALAKRLVGTWRSEAVARVALRFVANGTFEEVRAGPAKAGTYDVIGREVRLKFDDGTARAFRVDAEPAPGEFVSAGQTWKRESP